MELQTPPSLTVSKPDAAVATLLQTLPAELFLEVVEQSSIAISITDPHANILYCNRALCELTGYRRSDLTGRNHNVLASQQTPKSRYQEMWSQLTSARPWTGRLINQRKDGSVYLAEVTITPVTSADGVITHYLGMHKDISVRYGLERRVHNQMAMIEAVLNAAPSAIVVLDEQQQVILDNLVYKTLRTDLKGVEPFEALGLAAEPDHQKPLVPLVIRGQTRWYSVHSQLLHELNEEAELYFVEGRKRACRLLIITDQTERRQQQEQGRLAMLGAELAAAKQAAVIREALDAALVQLQAPLNMLQAARQLDPVADCGSHTVMAVALEEGESAMRRLQACQPVQTEEPLVPLSAHTLLQDLQDLCLPGVGGHKGRLQFVIPAAGACLLDGQRLRLLAALSLLVERGLQRTEALADAWVRVGAEPSAQGVDFYVEDNAPGMPQGAHRLLAGQPGGQEGALLALSLVQSVANEHRGMVEVTSVSDGAHRITLHLPSSLSDRRLA
ncbi:nitrogen fixation negative regulator NifL [Pseudaeromonas paramecii]|uniref:PAS domain S-box protein n=1 Tax=Pseudaeromonas paramecii TaxID=2138166 RepID=A0ABP8QGG9_9GAMM